MLGESSSQPGVDPHTVERALDEVQNSPWSLPDDLTALGYIFGMVVLAVGAARLDRSLRSRAVPLALAVFLTGTEHVNPVEPASSIPAGAALMLVAGIAVAVSLLRVEASELWTSS